MLLNITQLEYLIETMKLGSYANAAKKLFVTPQAISRSINELEKEVGVKLFEKSGRNLQPTDFAHSFAFKVEETLNSFNDLAFFAEGYRNHAFPLPFSLGLPVIPFLGDFFYEEDFTDFAVEHPRILLTLLSRPSEACLSALHTALMDAAVIFGEADGTDIICRNLFSFYPSIAICRNNRISHQEDISFADLSSCRRAMPKDLRCCYATLLKRATEKNISLDFEDVSPTLNNMHSFMANGGAVLVSANSTLPNLCPDIEIKPFSQEDAFTLPVHFAYRNSAKSGAAEILYEYLCRISKKPFAAASLSKPTK